MQVFNVVQSEIQHQGNVIQSMEANQQHFEAHIQNQTVDFAQQQATVAGECHVMIGRINH